MVPMAMDVVFGCHLLNMGKKLSWIEPLLERCPGKFLPRR